MRFTGASSTTVNDRGGLSFRLPHHRFSVNVPVAWQTIDGVRHQVAARIVQTSSHEYGFRLGHYDPTRELIIDPTLTYSTFLGGSDDEGIFGIAFDPQGSIYVAGETSSTNFSNRHALQPHVGGSYDAFIAKLDHSGKHLIYSTYLGGSNYDHAVGLSVDDQGSVALAGLTNSTDFPTLHPRQPNLAGNYDGFVARLASSGDKLIFSTYLGGVTYDSVNDISRDPSGNIYVAGNTSSIDFAVTPHALQPICDQGALPGFCNGDAFVAKFNATGTELLYSTYLGGSGSDTAQGLAVDDTGAIYLAGQTASKDFPTAHPYQTAIAGFANAFLTKIDPEGDKLVYSTYLGGSQFDAAYGLAVDATHHPFITGCTSSPNFPTLNPVQPALLGQLDGFVTKLSSNGDTLAYSTYLGGSGLGGSGQTLPFRIAVDPSGAASVAGFTSATNFPLSDPFQSSYQGGNDDAFLTRLASNGASLSFSTYLGGSGDDFGYAVATTLAGALWIGGSTTSTEYPTFHAFQSKYAGGPFDAFLSQVSLSPTDSISILKDALANPAASHQLPAALKEQLSADLDQAAEALRAKDPKLAREELDLFDFELLIALFEDQLTPATADRLAIATLDLRCLIPASH